MSQPTSKQARTERKNEHETKQNGRQLLDMSDNSLLVVGKYMAFGQVCRYRVISKRLLSVLNRVLSVTKRVVLYDCDGLLHTVQKYCSQFEMIRLKHRLHLKTSDVGIITKSSKLAQMDLSNPAHDFVNALCAAAPSLPALKDLFFELPSSKYEPISGNVLKTFGPQLTSLQVHFKPFPDLEDQRILRESCSNLTSLSLHISPGQLEFGEQLANFPHLTKLTLSVMRFTTQETRLDLTSAAKVWKKLESLTLENFDVIQGLIPVAKSCTNLKIIWLDCKPELISEFLKHTKSLEHVQLQCSNVAEVLRDLFSDSIVLETVTKFKWGGLSCCGPGSFILLDVFPNIDLLCCNASLFTLGFLTILCEIDTLNLKELSILSPRSLTHRSVLQYLSEEFVLPNLRYLLVKPCGLDVDEFDMLVSRVRKSKPRCFVQTC